MRSSDEMAERVLSRGRAEIKERQGRKRRWLLTAAIVLPCCAIFMLTAGLWMGGWFERPIDPSVSEQSGTKPPLEGHVNYLSAIDLTSEEVHGKAFQSVKEATSVSGSSADAAPPAFEFQYGYIHVVARAVEELSGTYETLPDYGGTTISSYRLFRMTVLDPLDSELAGDFYYLLPAHLKGDLTAYDALLISMTQLPYRTILRHGGRLIAFDYLFADPQDHPELGNITAFSDGVFDERLWQEKSWLYGYQFARIELETGERIQAHLVARGTTLKKALRVRRGQIREWGEWATSATVKHFTPKSEEARALLDEIAPFTNGVFQAMHYMPVQGGGYSNGGYAYRRYINGCPTNEWVAIDRDTEAVYRSDFRFETADMEGLPDLGAYIAALDLASFLPEHTDPTGKQLLHLSAVGWYEKTATGVYSVVKLQWRYCAEGDCYRQCIDETFLLLDADGAHTVSREELVSLIGANPNISFEKYGAEFYMPM